MIVSPVSWSITSNWYECSRQMPYISNPNVVINQFLGSECKDKRGCYHTITNHTIYVLMDLQYNIVIVEPLFRSSTVCSSTKCYTFMDETGRTWADARTHCVSLGGELLPDIETAQTDMEQAIHGRMCITSDIIYWTGTTTGMCIPIYVVI